MVTLLCSRVSYSRVDREGDSIDLDDEEALALIAAGSAVPYDPGDAGGDATGDAVETMARSAPERMTRNQKRLLKR